MVRGSARSQAILWGMLSGVRKWVTSVSAGQIGYKAVIQKRRSSEGGRRE